MLEHDVLIIGAGLAGMRAALAAKQNGVDVAMVSKVHPVRSHSCAAQGGINAALTDRGDDWRDHAYDTIKGSDFLGDQDAITLMCQEAGAEVIAMEHMGAIFNRDQDGRLGTRNFGGQRQARTFFVADFTGQAMLHVMYEQIMKAGIRVYEEWFVLSLIVEDGELRGRGSIEKLYGSCFESALGPVEAKGSYIGGVLSIEDFSGSFERGTINPLDRDSKTLSPVRGRPAFRIVLRPPFPYQASIAVNEVDATRWLEGISSDVGTSSGTLTVKADLNGNLGTLIETRGRGSIHLERSRLWSIPLFRELLREFGLDHTVMFDEVQFDFEIDDKVITMEDLVLRSPLLKLVGRGTLDKEGRLNHRLEVHYSIVDKITPFRRLFYLVQNVFVSVKIRGDLSRPLVLLSNGLFSLFRGEPDVTPSLPLPGLSPLPRRF